MIFRYKIKNINIIDKQIKNNKILLIFNKIYLIKKIS